MKPTAILGIVLIVLGIVAFAYQGWFPHRDTVAQIGPVAVERERSTPAPLAPILGTLALAAGVGLLVSGLSRRG